MPLPPTPPGDAPPPSSWPELAPLGWAAPWGWLARGWADLRRAPGIGLFYGACFAGMGWLLVAAFWHAPAWLLALAGGFLLMGPFLSMGLYRVSQRLEAGLPPDLGDSLFAWDTRTGTLALFGLVLLVLEMLWGRATLMVVALSFKGMPDLQSSVLRLLSGADLGFALAWFGVGAVFAGLIYGLSVIAIPMILDREVDAITAALSSLRLVLGQPGVMLLWGALITLLVTLAMLPGFLGLLLVGPWLGHASWHAYREAAPRR